MREAERRTGDLKASRHTKQWGAEFVPKHLGATRQTGEDDLGSFRILSKFHKDGIDVVETGDPQGMDVELRNSDHWRGALAKAYRYLDATVFELVSST